MLERKKKEEEERNTLQETVAIRDSHVTHFQLLRNKISPGNFYYFLLKIQT
jgi:hypothetical protein